MVQSQRELSNMKVSVMNDGFEYTFTNYFFQNRSNETTIIVKHGDIFNVTYRGGDFISDQTMVFNTDAFYWFDFNVPVEDLTLSELEEAAMELYSLYMAGQDEDFEENVTVLIAGEA
ncbi:hypothetical protein POF51_29665 [Brevibacillus sp. AG]|uniref:hypothetical protein n=1 Tax=Brevibacillus sp. AG TaxID=3020891 RepID=UPI00232A8BBA|nr:hypothetical protein [Brevibacillus sp. AG]MDC0764892.1 hypothetical protein [Brevibacillus sp. AG]